MTLVFKARQWTASALIESSESFWTSKAEIKLTDLLSLDNRSYAVGLQRREQSEGNGVFNGPGNNDHLNPAKVRANQREGGRIYLADMTVDTRELVSEKEGFWMCRWFSARPELRFIVSRGPTILPSSQRKFEQNDLQHENVGICRNRVPVDGLLFRCLLQALIWLATSEIMTY